MIKSAPSSAFLRAALTTLLMAAAVAPNLSQAFTLQTQEKKKPNATDTGKKEEPKVPTAKEVDKEKKKAAAQQVQLSPVETIAELTILAYGGRKQLETVRSALQEDGTIRLATDQGDLTGSYSLRSMRKEKSWQDLLRVDIELKPAESSQPHGQVTIKYVIAFNGASVWSAQNGQYVNPRPDAETAFRAQMTREYMALLRYKEDGSKLETVGPETVVGVDTNVIDLTNPNGEKTRFWISARTYRIVHSEYELKLGEGKPPTKYHIAYYYTPYRVVQGTLVPVRRVMSQDGKVVQEITLGPINYSAKLDPEIFQHLQEQ